MSHIKKHEQDKVQDERKAQSLVPGQASATVEGDTAAASSSTLMVDTPGHLPTARASSLLQGFQEAFCSIASKDTPSSKSKKDSKKQKGKSQSTPQVSPFPKFLLTNMIENEVVKMVNFLSVKYTTNMPVTEAEMLKNVIKEHKDAMPVIFKSACEWMLMIFGIDVKEVDPVSHTYILVKALDLSYDGRLSDDQGIPKAGLLILVLGMIYMEGNCAPEEKIWELLQKIGVYPDKKDFIYGYPRKILTKELVQERYIEYRQVPNSDPARYEFLWGPRAYDETTKIKILEFFCLVTETTPLDFPSLYLEALEEEEEKAKAAIAAKCVNAGTRST